MKYLLPVIFQLLAFGVAMAEILLPSFGLLTALCLGLLGYSWYLIATTLDSGAIIAFVLADLALIPAGIFLGLRLLGKSPLSHRSHIEHGTGREIEENRLQSLVGKTALVERDLRPAGKIVFQDESLEATTQGDYLAKGSLARIIAVQNGILVVTEARPGEDSLH